MTVTNHTPAQKEAENVVSNAVAEMIQAGLSPGTWRLLPAESSPEQLTTIVTLPADEAAQRPAVRRQEQAAEILETALREWLDDDASIEQHHSSATPSRISYSWTPPG